MEGGDLGAGLHAQLGVEVRQRLVHQEHLRLAHDRPTHRHPLALPARQLGRLAIEVLLEVEDAGRLADPLAPAPPSAPAYLEVEADVLGDRHVRVQRVGLEDHRDVAVLRRQRGDVAIADVDRALVDRLEPGQHPQRRRLAASRWADEHEELAVGDGQVEWSSAGWSSPLYVRVAPANVTLAIRRQDVTADLVLSVAMASQRPDCDGQDGRTDDLRGP